MEVEKILHMKRYANNSLTQKFVITKTRPVLEESIREMYHALLPEILTIADFGCSSGPNALLVAKDIIDIFDKERQMLHKKPLQFKVFLNDLPTNDFNALFNLLPGFYQKLEEEKGKDFGPCFVSGTPKSFYGQVFPDHFLQFAYSSYSIHWLSKVPPGLVSSNGDALNKGNIYLAKTSPPEILQAYYAQFTRDFLLFLSSRAKEMVPGGHMVLTITGCNQRNNPNLLWELLDSSLHNMVAEGVIEKEQLDRFNMPYYAPTIEEVRELVEVQESFSIKKLETIEFDWSIEINQNLNNQADFFAKSVRVVLESVLATAFSEEAIDDLFLRLKMKVREHMAQGQGEHLTIVVSLIKKD